MSRADIREASVGVYSYGDKISNTHRPQVNYQIQVSGLRDPQSSGNFRSRFKNGTAEPVQAYVHEDPRVQAIVDNVKLLCHVHLRSDARDNRWLSFGIMDHHGKWLGPAIAEVITNALVRDGYAVNVKHYDLEEP